MLVLKCWNNKKQIFPSFFGHILDTSEKLPIEKSSSPKFTSIFPKSCDKINFN